MRIIALGIIALTGACGKDVSGPVAPGGSYWPALDKTRWYMGGRWEDLSGHDAGGELDLYIYIAGTDYDAAGRPVKIIWTNEVDGPYYFRMGGGEVWTNWAEHDPKADYHRWLKLPPAAGQRWQDDTYRVAVTGPYDLSVPLGDFHDVYRARYDFVQEPGQYEVWWYAAGVGCIQYEAVVPGVKHELFKITWFKPGA